MKVRGIILCWLFFVKQKMEEGWSMNGAANYHAKILYQENEDGTVTTITYEDFAQISKDLFLRASQYLILGEPYAFNYGNGYLKASRLERNEAKLVPTNDTLRRLKLDKNAKREYYTTKDYCTISWRKQTQDANNRLPEKFHYKTDHSYLEKYRFVIARDNNNTALKQRFSAAIIRNPTLQYAYDYFPNSLNI